MTDRISERKKSPTGRWIKDWGSSDTTYRCSNCNITQTITIFEKKPQFKYCPYCGTPMLDEKTITKYEMLLVVKYKRGYPSYASISVIETLEEIRNHFTSMIKELINVEDVEIAASLNGMDGTLLVSINLGELNHIDYNTIKNEFTPESHLFLQNNSYFILSGVSNEVKINETKVNQ